MSIDRIRCLVGAECVRLAALGSAEAIARELHSRGMSGQLEEQTECPLARGICDTLMISTGRLSVTKYDVFWGNWGSSEGQWLCSFKEKLSVLGEFVEQFDANRFPHLIQD